MKFDFQKNIPRNYHNEADLKQAIKDKTRKHETTSLSNQDEKTLLRDIDLLKKAMPDMKKLSEIEPELQKIREERKKIQSELDGVKRIIDEQEEKIQDVKAAS